MAATVMEAFYDAIAQGRTRELQALTTASFEERPLGALRQELLFALPALFSARPDASFQVKAVRLAPGGHRHWSDGFEADVVTEGRGAGLCYQFEDRYRFKRAPSGLLVDARSKLSQAECGHTGEIEPARAAARRFLTGAVRGDARRVARSVTENFAQSHFHMSLSEIGSIGRSGGGRARLQVLEETIVIGQIAAAPPRPPGEGEEAATALARIYYLLLLPDGSLPAGPPGGSCVLTDATFVLLREASPGPGPPRAAWRVDAWIVNRTTPCHQPM